MHPHRPDLHLGDAPRVCAEQEDVPRRGLHREVLVDRAHRHPVGIEDHAVVASLGDSPSAGQRGQTRTRRARRPPVHRIVVQVCAAPPTPGLDSPARQRHDTVEVLACQVGVGRGLRRHRPQRLDLALVGGGDLGHELLGQHVERRDRRFEKVEPTLAHGREQRGALDQLVPCRRVEPAGGRAVAMVVGPAHTLEEGPDGAGRSDLADELHGAHVDPQLERRRRHERTQVARAQARLDDAPPGGREASVVCGHQE